MHDVAETVQKIEREALANKVHEVRRRERMDVGEVARQGDLYFHRVEDAHPRGRRIDERQLAPGVTTGSRHVTSPAHVHEGTTPPPWAPTALVGPCLLTSSNRRVVVEHPEHAWLDLPRGTYQVTYQRDERTGAAVRD